MKRACILSSALLIVPCHQGGSVCFSQVSAIEVKLWPADSTSATGQSGQELIENRPVEQNEFGLNRSISLVTDPTLFVYLPGKGNARTMAVIILPGGGYRRIVIDKEGHDVARWLNSRGISAMVLKYRTAPKGVQVRGPDADARMRDLILSDAEQALRVVHSKADEWQIDRESIGVLGFSAGGHLGALLCSVGHNACEAARRSTYAASYRPRFLGLVYPALGDDFMRLECSHFPTTFIVSAADDTVAPLRSSDSLFSRLRQKNIPVELHRYSIGGHGFGLGIRGGEVANWKEEFIRWLKGEKIIKGEVFQGERQ